MEVYFLLLLVAFQFKHSLVEHYLDYPKLCKYKSSDREWLSVSLQYALYTALATFVLIVTAGILIYPNMCSTTVLLVGIGFPIVDAVAHFITARGTYRSLQHIVGILLSYTFIYLI